MDELKTFIADSPSPIFIVDGNTFQIQHANPAALGNSDDTVQGKKFEEFVTVVKSEITGKNYAHFGGEWLGISKTSLNGSKGNFQIIELKARTQIPDRETLESWKRMIAVMLHRLRSPLTGINGYVEMMEEENSDSKLEKRISSINKGLTYIFDLMDELEVLYNIPSNYDKADYSSIDLKELIHEVLLKFNEAERRRLKVTPEDKIQKVKSDRTPLAKAVKHVIANALEHSDDNAIEVKFSANDYGNIIIKNTCDNFPEELTEQLFYPFVTTKATNLGIGLTMALLYIQQLGGTIFFNAGDDEFHCQLLFPLNNHQE